MSQIDAPELPFKALAHRSRRASAGRARGGGGQRRGGSTALRALDLIVAASALVFFAPLMVAVSLAIWLQDRGPVFFAHRRVGKDGRHFRCLKFRTMATDADKRLEALLREDPDARREWERDCKLRNDVRVTRIGSFLRKSSLDELPQLFNVLRGEMSLVGPRPITDAEIRRYGRWYRHYCAVLPGITGVWQVSGRNDVDYRRRVAMDVLYVRKRSLGCNLLILARTLGVVLLRSGAY